MAWSAPEEWSRWDPEELMICPFDEVHKIKAKRFQHHLLKCRRNHPDKDFVSCPFNAKHLMLRSELKHHVIRCPDRSAIEQYNYKGNEKDEDGFFFKGDTSVPTYYHSEKLEDPLSENWDDEDDNLQRPELIGNVPPIARTPSLSPEDRERLKRRMRSEAVSRGANPERLLRSEESPARLDFHGCSNVSPFGNLEKNSSSHGHISPQRPKTKSNPIFQHCIGKMQNLNGNTNNEPSKEHGLIRDETEQNALRHDLDGYFTSSKSADLRIRNMGDQVARLKLGVERNSQEVHEASGVRGVTGPRGSTGIVPPHFSGFGRARLAAEARKNNFGGISSSPPKAAGNGTVKTVPSYGRGRGILSYC